LKEVQFEQLSNSEPRDYYTEFIEGSRWLRKEHAVARANWFNEIVIVDKEVLLFEFEMLLKGIVCFGNPVNHPGPVDRKDPAVVRDFKIELTITKEILGRIIEVGKKFISTKGKSTVFQRYLKSIIAQDDTRFKMVKQSLNQDMPNQSIEILVSALENVNEIVEGLLQTPRISYRVFSSIIEVLQREIHRSTFFNPLAVLEFRNEFDKFRPENTRRLIQQITSEPARKVMTLTFLSLFRLLKYNEAIKRSFARKVTSGVILGWLAVLRSDIRALTIFFKRESGKWISSGFGSSYEQLNPALVNNYYEYLEIEFENLKSLKGLLTSIGDQLRFEQRKVYEQQLPSISSILDMDEFANTAVAATNSLREFIQNAAVLLINEFDESTEGEQIFDDFISEKTRSARLRRDIWMFQKVLKAFIEKASGSVVAADSWSKMSTFRFVREFVGYFKSMGYQLLRYSDYEKFDKFIQLVDRLQKGDVLEVQRVSYMIIEFEDFLTYLDQTFEAVSQRVELQGVEFDKKDAAQTLILILQH